MSAKPLTANNSGAKRVASNGLEPTDIRTATVPAVPSAANVTPNPAANSTNKNGTPGPAISVSPGANGIAR